MAESKITYLLKLDTSGAVQEVDKLSKSFDQLDREQQKFAKNAKEVSLSKLKESLKDLESLKDSLQKAGTTATLFNKSLTEATQKLFERLQTTEAPKLIKFLETQINLTEQLATEQRKLLNDKIAAQNARYAPTKAAMTAESPSFSKGMAQAEANALKLQADLLAKRKTQEAARQAQHKAEIQAEVARRADIARLASTAQLAYNIKFIQQRPTNLPTATTSAFLKPPAKWKPYDEDLKLLQQAKEKTEKSLANAISNLNALKSLRANQEATWKADWDALGKANWEAIQAKQKEIATEKALIAELDKEIARKQQLEGQRKKAEARQTNKLNFYQTGFGQFTAVAERLAERTPAQRNADTKAARQEYQDRLAAERQAAKERETIATQAAALRKQQEKELADFLAGLEQDRLNKARATAKQFFAEKKAFEEQAYKDVAAKANQELAAIKKAESDTLVAKQTYAKEMIAQEEAIKQQFIASQKAQQKAAEDYTKAMAAQGEVLKAQFLANQQLQAKQQAANAYAQAMAAQGNTMKAQFQAQFAPKSGVIGTATTPVSPVSKAPFTSQAAQQASQNYNAATKAAAAYQAQVQQANTASVLLDSAIVHFNAQVEKLVNSFAKTKEAFDVYRNGITSSQRATLDLAESIKYEIGLRERQKQAYANLSPELKKVTQARQDAAFFEQEIARATKSYYESISTAKTAQEVLNLKNTFQQTFAVLDAGYKKAIADGKAAEQNFMAQVAAVEQLRKVSLASIDRNQANFASSGRFAYLQGTGASTQEVQMQKLRDTIAKTEAAYAKLVARTKEKLGATDDPNKIAKITQHYDRWSAKLSEINNKNQTLLGNVEKLAGAHKPLLERIFDLVVGYRLINSAVNTFTNALRSVPNMGLQYETTYATLKATFSVTAKVNEELKFLDQLAQDAGISIDSLRTSFVDFAASAKFSGEKVENINEIFANISKAGMVLHLPADKMKSAFTALNQMYAKNQVMMEELKRQLGNQLPAAVNIFALSMGKTTRQLMDDMKKGLVVPKETILNFSRTYAAIFADPASMAYASQGVNAHIQRLSTAWTNLAVEIYEKSKGLIKGGLDVATASLEFFRTHIEGVTDVVVGLSLALGTSLVVQLGKVTLAMMATRNAAIASAGAMTALTGVSATAGGVSALATLGTYFKNIALSIPPWLRLIAVLGTAGMVLKNVEAGTTVVTSSIKTLNGQAVKLEESITIGDMVLAGWDALIAKAQKFLNIQDEIKAKAAAQNPKETRNTVVPFVAEQVARLSPLSSVGGTLVRTGYAALYALAEQAKEKEVLAKEAATQTELLNEKIKETLLAGTSGTVDETMVGVNKVVTTALTRIDQEFNLATSKIKSSTDLATAKITGEINKTAALEKVGAITAKESYEKQLALQKQINKLKLDAIDAEIKALDEKIKKEEAISQTQIDKSKEATTYQEAYKNLGIKQSFRQEIPKALVEIGAYKSIEDAATALQDKEAYKLQDTTIQRAIDQYNATHPNQGFKALEDVSEAAMKQANENTVKTWKIYEARMDAHAAILNRVSEGVLETNRIAEEERKLFEELVAKMPQTANTFQADEASAKIGASIWGQRYFATDAAKVASGVDKTTLNKVLELITKAAVKEGIDPEFAKTIASIESKFNPAAMSTFVPKKGAYAGQVQHAYGVMQLYRPDRKGFTGGTLEENINEGVKQLASELRYFNGDYTKAAAAYNAGRAAVEKHSAETAYKETRDYVAKMKALYQPSTSAIKSGELKSEEATRESLIKRQEKVAEKNLITLQQKNEEEVKALEERFAALGRVTEELQSTFSFTKTKQEQALARLQTSAIPLTETQLADQTAAIKEKFAPELTKEIDAIIASIQEKLKVTVVESTKQGLRAEIVNLEKERATIQAEALQAKVTVAINKVIPLQTALERKQFEIQKSLEDSLEIFNEETFKLNQQISQEETLKLLATEKERLKDKSNGLTEEEINKNTQLIALAEKQIAQLNQIELIKARIARERDLSASTRELADAQAANLPLNRASRMGVSGGFVGAIATEEAANYKYAEKMASYQQDIVGFQAEQSIAKTTTEWNKLQTQIEQTTSAMYDLSLAKDAVLNQAVADTMDSISGHFVAWANGAEKAKDAFRGIAIDFAKMVQEIIMNELKMLAVKGIMSLISGGFSGGGGVGSVSSLGGGRAGVLGFASGGQVSGVGTGTSDSIPAIVPIGSYVLNAKATAKAKRNRLINLSHGEVVFSPEQAAQIGLDNLERMNKQNFASGGLVGGTTTSTSAKAAKQNSNVYNINVAVPQGTSNPQQFGNDVAVAMMKAIAKEEAKKQVNQYNKLKARG
jgi:tape measure domain-containing protein